MKRKKNNKYPLDEMQELIILKASEKGLWIAFWCLFAVIAIQVCLTLSLKQVAGELAVFFILCIYQLAFGVKNGIWSKTQSATTGKNAAAGFIAFLIMVLAAVIVAVIHPAIFSVKYIIIMICLSLFVFASTFVLAEIMRKAAAKKRSQLDNLQEDEKFK